MLKAGALILFATLAAPQSIPPSQHPPSQSKGGNLPATHSQQQKRQSVPSPPPREIVDAVTRAINAAAHKAETSEAAQQPDNSAWWFNFLLVAFTGGLVVVGAFSTVILWNTDKSTAKNAEAALKAATATSANTDALKTQLRAKVSGEISGMQFKPKAETVRVAVDLVNNGQTPAYDCMSLWEIEVRKHPLIDEVKFDSEKLFKTPKAVVYPGRPRPSERERSIVEELTSIITEETHALYVTGVVRFKDEFGDSQTGDSQTIEFNYFLDKEGYQRWRELARQHPGKAVPAGWQISEFNNVAHPPERNT